MASSSAPISPAAAELAKGGLVRVGLIGRGIQGSRSPALHMQEAAAQGFDLVYSLFDLDAAPWAGVSLASVVAAAEEDGYAGVNVTYPFKQDVIPLLDQLSPDAERLGAVNTIVFRNGRRIGHNTDWSGFAESLNRGLPERRKERVLQVGAGGAGAAVAYALLHTGVGRLAILDQDADRAAAVAAKLESQFGAGRAAVAKELAAELVQADGLVNATPIGMVKHPGCPVPAALLRPELWVADIVYVPIETELLASARAKGCAVLDGGGMAVFQAVGAFRLFTGVEPDADRMRAGFLKDIGFVGE